MVNLENLTGAKFKGHFFKDPILTMHYLRSLKEIPECLTKEELETIEKALNADIRKNYFEMNVLSQNSEGLFVGTAKDQYGKSGVVGRVNVKNGIIFFYKHYLPKRNVISTIDREDKFKTIEYFGNINSINGKVSASGNYRVKGFSTGTGGKWEMETRD